MADGKPGHDNQSLALVENLKELGGIPWRDIPLDDWKSYLRMRTASETPSMIVGAGRSTHLGMLALARRFDCPSVVLMKPTVSTPFYDLCLVPEHDFEEGASLRQNIFLTKGMLNRIPLSIPHKESRGLILIGGPSKHHKWDGGPLREAIERIVTERPELTWEVTDSRRTPEGFLKELGDLPLTLHSSQETDPDWLPQTLVAAQEVWVSEDSMSMIYEALTAKAKVGLLPMPRATGRGRIIRGLDGLIADNWVKAYDPKDNLDLPPPRDSLNESFRCARALLDRYFASLRSAA